MPVKKRQLQPMPSDQGSPAPSPAPAAAEPPAARVLQRKVSTQVVPQSGNDSVLDMVEDGDRLLRQDCKLWELTPTLQTIALNRAAEPANREYFKRDMAARVQAALARPLRKQEQTAKQLELNFVENEFERRVAGLRRVVAFDVSWLKDTAGSSAAPPVKPVASPGPSITYEPDLPGSIADLCREFSWGLRFRAVVVLTKLRETLEGEVLVNPAARRWLRAYPKVDTTEKNADKLCWSFFCELGKAGVLGAALRFLAQTPRFCGAAFYQDSLFARSDLLLAVASKAETWEASDPPRFMPLPNNALLYRASTVENDVQDLALTVVKFWLTTESGQASFDTFFDALDSVGRVEPRLANLLRSPDISGQFGSRPKSLAALYALLSGGNLTRAVGAAARATPPRSLSARVYWRDASFCARLASVFSKVSVEVGDWNKFKKFAEREL